jgi:hydroxymethylbilane synthase
VNNSLIIATRESRLALWQAHFVRDCLKDCHQGLDVQILGMTTVGDHRLDRPLSEIGGKGLFTKELEIALLEGRAHLAVHSLKDVPMQLGEEFLLAAVMKREDPRDALVSSRFKDLADLPAGAKIGTSSLRRAAQLKARFPNLTILPLRGNLDTRLGKLDQGEYDAIVLAAAGLKRLGLAQRIASYIPTDIMIPSPGQGALGIEIMARDQSTALRLQPLIDPDTTAAVSAERKVSMGLGGNCKLPLAAHCVVSATGLHLTSIVSNAAGTKVLYVEQSSTERSTQAAIALGAEVASKLLAQGAAAILAQ